MHYKQYLSKIVATYLAINVINNVSILQTQTQPDLMIQNLHQINNKQVCKSIILLSKLLSNSIKL